MGNDADELEAVMNGMIRKLLDRVKVRLREGEWKLAEAEAVIILAQHELGTEHPVWSTLDDYDGSGDAIRRLKELCDDGTLGFPFSMTRGYRL